MAVTDELHSSIVRQVEFYFGDVNLPRDKFLQGEMAKHSGWMPLEKIMGFKKMQTLTSDTTVVVTALLAAPNQLVEVSECRTKVKRSESIPIPSSSAASGRIALPPPERDMDEMDRTLFITCIDQQVTEEMLFELFLQVGPLYAVKIVNKDEKKLPFAFAEFKHVESVEYAINLLNGVRLFNKPISIKPRSGSNTKRVLDEKIETERRMAREREEQIMIQQRRVTNLCDPSLYAPRPPLMAQGQMHQPEMALQPPYWMQNAPAMCGSTADYLRPGLMSMPPMGHMAPPLVPPPVAHMGPQSVFRGPADVMIPQDRRGRRDRDDHRSRSRDTRDWERDNPYRDFGQNSRDETAHRDRSEDIFERHRRRDTDRDRARDRDRDRERRRGREDRRR